MINIFVVVYVRVLSPVNDKKNLVIESVLYIQQQVVSSIISFSRCVAKETSSFCHSEYNFVLFE